MRGPKVFESLAWNNRVERLGLNGFSRRYTFDMQRGVVRPAVELLVCDGL